MTALLAPVGILDMEIPRCGQYSGQCGPANSVLEFDPAGDDLAKTIEEAMTELRRDVARWHSEMANLRAQGQHDLVERMKGCIEEAERILHRWEK